MTRGGGDELERAVAAAIAAVAHTRHLNHADLARVTSISQPMVSLLLDGKRTLTLKYIQRFAEALGMKPADFFPQESAQPATLAALEQHVGRTYVQTINMIRELRRNAVPPDG